MFSTCPAARPVPQNGRVRPATPQASPLQHAPAEVSHDSAIVVDCAAVMLVLGLALGPKSLLTSLLIVTFILLVYSIAWHFFVCWWSQMDEALYAEPSSYNCLFVCLFVYYLLPIIVSPLLCNAWTEYKFTCVCVCVCVCVCLCVRHTFSQLAYRSDPSTDFYSW